MERRQVVTLIGESLANRKSAINNKVKAEGIVVSGVEDETISFKVINPEWLLKNGE